MGIVSGVESKVSEWVWHIAAKRVIAGLVGAIMAQVVNGSAGAFLANHGVAVDPVKFQSELTMAGVAGSVAVHDWLRLKTGWKWL